MTDKITIVTGFFDIGRKDYKEIPRTNQQYIEYFKRWARIKNELVCYVETEELKNTVLNIRAEFGLKEKTRVVIVDKIFDAEPELLEKMTKVENDINYLNFRLRKEAPENKARYNYIMLMKLYCLKDAAQNYVKDGFVAWLDFGWEHGGKAYMYEEDYNFEWKYAFDEGKATIFFIPPLTTVPIFEMVRTLGPDCLMGAPLVVDYKVADQFYNTTISAAGMLADIGLIDDDQLIFTYVARTCPELISLKESYWFHPIKDYGGSHFRVKPPAKKTFVQKIKNLIKKIFHIRRKG